MLYNSRFKAMNCDCQITVETFGIYPTWLDYAPQWVQGFEQRLSRFRLDSELSYLNRRIGKWTSVSPILFENISAARYGAEITDGLYNPLILDALAAEGYGHHFPFMRDTQIHLAVGEIEVKQWKQIKLDPLQAKVCIPARIDLGGIAKGWTAQYIAHRLSIYGNVLVNMGGDIVTTGNQSWEIEIRHPLNEQESLIKVSLKTMAIVTSGKNRRIWRADQKFKHHIIDPRTNRSAETDILSVTVIADSVMDAEAYAKAGLIVGSDKCCESFTDKKIASLIVCDNLDMKMTGDFSGFVI